MIEVPMPEQTSEAIKSDQDAIEALSEAEDLTILIQPDNRKKLILLFGQPGYRKN